MFDRMNQISLPAHHHDPALEIAGLAQRYRRANGPLMRFVGRMGNAVEQQLSLLPDGARKQVEAAVASALEQAHMVASAGQYAPDLGPRAAPIAAAVTGAIGGAGGWLTALPEIPVTVTLILHAIRREAEAQGFDPNDPVIRAECLRVFSAGSPLAGDDGVNSAFLGARLALSGSTVQNLIAAVVPRLAAAFGQKLAAQAVPVLGAITGATLNSAFLNYYRELARIRFALLRLAEQHGAVLVEVRHEARVHMRFALPVTARAAFTAAVDEAAQGRVGWRSEDGLRG